MWVQSQDREDILMRVDAIRYKEIEPGKHAIIVENNLYEHTVAEYRTKEECITMMKLCGEALKQDAKGVQMASQEELDKTKEVLKEALQAQEEISAEVLDAFKGLLEELKTEADLDEWAFK